MRKYFSIGIVLLCLLGASSCKDKGNKVKVISAKEISALVQDTLTRITKSDVSTVTVGYYEENCIENRNKLRLLEKMGAINYQSEEIFDESGNSHVFVEVSLTAEGEKYIYKEEKKVETPAVEEDPDMVNRFAEENKKQISVDPENVVAVNPISAEEKYTVTKPKAKEPAKYASEVVTKELSLYELAKAHETKTVVSVLCNKRTIFKVRNIECDLKKADSIANAVTEKRLKEAQKADSIKQDSICKVQNAVNTTSKKGIVVEKIVVECNNGDLEKIQSLLNGNEEKQSSDCSQKKPAEKKYNVKPEKPVYNASAEVIVETSTVTPFGKVYGNCVKGEKKLYTCEFTYEDGWTLTSLKEVKSNKKIETQKPAETTTENTAAEMNEEFENQEDVDEQAEVDEMKFVSKTLSKTKAAAEQFSEEISSFDEVSETLVEQVDEIEEVFIEQEQSTVESVKKGKLREFVDQFRK